jgi:hypothetical protein
MSTRCETRVVLTKRCGFEIWVAAVLLDGHVVAYTTRWSEAGALQWCSDAKRKESTGCGPNRVQEAQVS